MTEGKVIMFLNSCGEGGQERTFRSSMMLLCVYFSDKFIFNSLPEIYALIITQNFLRVHLKVYHTGIPFYLSLFLSLSFSPPNSSLFSFVSFVFHIGFTALHLSERDYTIGFKSLCQSSPKTVPLSLKNTSGVERVLHYRAIFYLDIKVMYCCFQTGHLNDSILNHYMYEYDFYIATLLKHISTVK